MRPAVLPQLDSDRRSQQSPRFRINMNSPKSNQKVGGASRISEPSTSQGGKAPVHKPEEDSRRRTIIMEKKDGSFGFTIQSYGIHFKKEKEVEVITYVDSVEFNGSAARAGLREGDVILSINGMDVDKADHDTLVKFIQNCDTRMRMVVLFEDCVRKVDLQRHALDIKREINERVEELTQLYIMEHQITKEKSKTHSLPFQKKQTGKADLMIVHEELYVTGHKGIERKNSQSSQYMDNVKQETCEFEKNKVNQIVKAPSKSKTDQKSKKATRPQSRCYPCYQPQNDSNIDAYDLASPCCEPRYFKCHHHEKPSKSSKYPEMKESRDPHKERKESYKESRIPQKENKGPQKEKRDVYSQTKLGQLDETFLVPSGTGRRFDNTTAGAKTVSAHVLEETCSYSNFLDNLPKSKNVNQKKTSSNFTTKAFGGYGFGGYGFGTNLLKSTKSTNTEHVHGNSLNNEKLPTPSIPKNFKNPTKSTENLLVNAEYQDLSMSNPSVSYDCLHIIHQGTSSRHDRQEICQSEVAKTPKYVRQHSHNSRQHVVLKSFRKRRSNSAEMMRPSMN